ncbi:bifunctional 4-hydroxy-2-oxoglutarate aldolase/2-dehydro-3-deoxy-phosphogluconate aldolase [Zhaonella formicivorans]|uniref:bifunctional 4-hydroxy-2-oxoglutarate aldolase/2-dehydro-3-deoxy-phosphogluconate aldolase n=1 Tax=Zhaonella formicivorans TaxID=2528593 RepID=UPI0010D35585|nr:bifunctional 4-hydroxy-2-oxoglutarate aldolase/2-dehydro-3-deoxy-phosphogluconate aldolase [Zhaonella formicivorans]
MQKVLDIIKDTGLVAIIRGINIDSIKHTVQSLAAGGVRVLEVTFNTPGAEEMIRYLSKLPETEIMVGAGTVLDVETAKIAIQAGARFMLCPHLDPQIIELGYSAGIPVIPGVFSPSEFVEAWKAGAEMVKVFPAATLGAETIASALAPLAPVEIMAVGGVTLNNAGQFIEAGSAALGVGSELVDKKALTAGDYEAITLKAKKFFTQIQEARAKRGGINA